MGDFPSGAVAENPPSNSGDASLISGWATKIPQALGQLSPGATQGSRRAATKEHLCSGAHTPQLDRSLHPEQGEGRTATPHPTVTPQGFYRLHLPQGTGTRQLHLTVVLRGL